MSCPICGSKEIETLRRNDFFPVRKKRRCVNCHSIWKPQCSKRKAVFLILIGCFVFVFFGKGFYQGIEYMIKWHPMPDDRGASCVWCVTLPAIIIGIGLIVFGSGVLFGKFGKMAILQNTQSKKVRCGSRQ